MSRENVETVKRGVEAANRRDVDALLEVLDPEIEWRSTLLMRFEGEGTVYRGHEGIRQMLEDLFGALAEFHVEYSEIRDLGSRIVAIGRTRTRGTESGAVTESPFCTVTDIRNGKAILVRSYLDPEDALEAAGLEE